MQPNASSEPVSESRTSWKLPALIAGLLILQLALYARSFGVKMAFDDFIFVDEIPRGDLHGPWIFFRLSKSYLHYRPFTSVVFWAIAHHFPQTWEFWLRAADFGCNIGYATVLTLWMRELKLSLFACATATAALLFHPVLPQALGSIDGMDSIASSALLWLGAWCALKWRDRPILASVFVVICFFLAAGWKEYAFAMIPLAPWTAFCFSAHRRWRNSLIIFGAVMAAFFGMILIRHYTIPPGFDEGLGYASISPVQWLKNAVTIVAGLLFFGNSVWVFVHQSKPVLLMVLSIVAVAAGLILVGLFRQVIASDVVAEGTTPLGSRRRWIGFLILSFVAASFPVNVMTHVSEMYLPPLLLPLALLCGISVEGWKNLPQALRRAAGGLVVLALISSAWTIYAKVEGLRDVGFRAERQLHQILSLIPPDAHDAKIALVFDPTELPPRRSYAVYRAGDELLVKQPMALNRLVPERRLTLKSYIDGSQPGDTDHFDAILKWEFAKQEFVRVN